MINLIDAVPEIDGESEEGTRITSCTGHITIQDVHFRYPTRPGVRVLRSMDMVITPGSYVAIVGASGSGYVCVVDVSCWSRFLTGFFLLTERVPCGLFLSHLVCSSY